MQQIKCSRRTDFFFKWNRIICFGVYFHKHQVFYFCLFLFLKGDDNDNLCLEIYHIKLKRLGNGREWFGGVSTFIASNIIMKAYINLLQRESK